MSEDLELQPGAWYVFKVNNEDGSETSIGPESLLGAGTDRYAMAQFAREHNVSYWRHRDTGEVRRLTSQDLIASRPEDVLGRWLNGAEFVRYGQQVADYYAETIEIVR